MRFRTSIKRGVMTENSPTEAGVSSPGAFRCFRHAGRVNPGLPPTVSGHYLSSGERVDGRFLLEVEQAGHSNLAGEHSPRNIVRRALATVGPQPPRDGVDIDPESESESEQFLFRHADFTVTSVL